MKRSFAFRPAAAAASVTIASILPGSHPVVAAKDTELAAIRARFVGKTAYGYGGVVLGCAPRWVNFYALDAGFVVRDVPPRVRTQPYEPPGRYRDLYVGESRAEVIWRYGYPTDDAPLATVRHARLWSYDRVPLERFFVTFRSDRVVAFADLSVKP